MGVRSSHARRADTDCMTKDINETIKKAKKAYKGWGEFYICAIKNGDNTMTYFARGNNHNGTAIRHFKNLSILTERAKWVELEN